MDRIEWLKARRNGIGGSDASAVLGLSRWKTPLQVYLDKIATDEPADEPTNEYMEWGHRHEEAIAEKFQSKHPEFKIVKPDQMIYKGEPGFMLASPDRLILDAVTGEIIGVLEIKTADAAKRKAWEDGDIPDEYMIQCQHYHHVLNPRIFFLAVLCGGNRYFEFEISRNQEIINGLIEHETTFWKMVQAKTPPAVSSGDSKAIDLLYPGQKGKTVELDCSIESEFSAIEEIKNQIKELEKARDLHQNRIKAALGGAEVGTINGFTAVTYKEQTRAEYVCKASTFRVLRIK